MQHDGEGVQRIGATRGIPARVTETRPLTGISRRYADLRVRPKLMVLHNLFFLLLAFLVYVAVMDSAEPRIREARAREMTLILNAFSVHSLESEQTALRPYDIRTGTAGDFGLPDEAISWMNRYPGRIWQRQPSSEHLYKLIPSSNRFYRLTLPTSFYADVLRHLRWTLLHALGANYALTVHVLE
ncbi:MAG: hypothetical protein HY821_19825 [Acidobacteria bacterium]|nr:hypothetical protein [Acidobacteriota bacterium]